VSNAPEELSDGESSTRNIKMQLPGFAIEMPGTGITNPATTAVLIDPDNRNILFADGSTDTVIHYPADRYKIQLRSVLECQISTRQMEV
jgi:prepilin-type processing-associated H-X9-DG protein